MTTTVIPPQIGRTPYSNIPATELVGSFSARPHYRSMRTRSFYALVDASLVTNARAVGSASCVDFANDAVAAGIVFA